jgi:hypothetical protein
LAADDFGVGTGELEAGEASDLTSASVAADEPGCAHIAAVGEVNGDAGVVRVEPAHLDPAPDLDAELHRALTEDPFQLDLGDLEVPAGLATVAQEGIVPVDRACGDLNATEVPGERRVVPPRDAGGLGRFGEQPPHHRVYHGEQASSVESFDGGGVDSLRLDDGVGLLSPFDDEHPDARQS